MRRKKDGREYEFDLPEEKRYSAGEIILYVVVLVALVAALVVLGIMIWKVSSGLFSSDEEDTVKVTEQLEEDSGTAAEAGENQEASETGGSSSEDTKDEGTQSGQESASTGDTGAGAESSEGQSASTGSSSDDTSTATMTFTEVNETVTAKSATNLRSEPSTESSDTVVMVLESGVQVTRTGINSDTGWSRLSCDGQVLYAVSSLLTTDLTGQTTGETSSDPDRVTTQDGRVVIFTDCDDTVSAKIGVNLRTEPSTSQGDNTVYYELQNGETARRTGYSADAGWSRVEYDGQILYAVTSYLYVVE